MSSVCPLPNPNGWIFNSEKFTNHEIVISVFTTIHRLCLAAPEQPHSNQLRCTTKAPGLTPSARIERRAHRLDHELPLIKLCSEIEITDLHLCVEPLRITGNPFL